MSLPLDLFHRDDTVHAAFMVNLRLCMVFWYLAYISGCSSFNLFPSTRRLSTGFQDTLNCSFSAVSAPPI